MGYGFGGFLTAVGLILALAVTDQVSGVDLTTVGWILTAVGVVLLALTAATAGRRGAARSTVTTTDAAGNQSVRESRSQF